MGSIERQGGIAIWRQIADDIRQAIAGGEFSGSEALPGEMALAERFGVNRHTVRSAIAALVREGVLRAERGRGTFIEQRERLRFPIRERTRFSEGLAGQTIFREGRVVGAGRTAADPAIAAALDLASGHRLQIVEMLYRADGLPVSLATNYFPLPRFEGIEKAVRGTASITRALAACGVDDYRRKWTTLTASHAGTADREALQLSPGAIVMSALAVNVDPAGRPIQYSVTRFAADRMEITIEN